MRLRCLSLAACLLGVSPLCAADTPATVPTAVSASASLPSTVPAAPQADEACVDEPLARLLNGAGGVQPLVCQYTCRTNADCPPPPPECVGGCANRCCVYACPYPVTRPGGER